MYHKAVEEAKRPRQLSKQEITDDLRQGISAKGSSDTGPAQDPSNMQTDWN